MNEKIWFSLTAALFLGVGLYLRSIGSLNPHNASAISFAAIAVLCLWVLVRLYQKWGRLTPVERAAQPILGEMKLLFTFYLVFSVLDFFARGILPRFNIDQLTVSTIHWFVHLFLYAMFVQSLRVAVSFFNPRWKNWATILSGVIAIAALVAFVIHPDSYKLIPGTTDFALISDPLVFLLTIILAMATQTLGGLYLIIAAFLQSDRVVRLRAILLGFGFILTRSEAIATQTHNEWTPLLILLAFISSFYFTSFPVLLTLQPKPATDTAPV